MTRKKIGFVVTHCQDAPETATLAFIVANAAVAMDVEPVIMLQAEGVRLALSGGAESAAAEGLPPVSDLLATVLGAGNRIMVCSTCMAARGITEDQLLDGFFAGGAAMVVEAMLTCENFVRY
jgi:uncharacterized protein